jgi:hypothetical protein
MDKSPAELAGLSVLQICRAILSTLTALCFIIPDVIVNYKKNDEITRKVLQFELFRWQ